MKLTKRQLKRIIKEELGRVMEAMTAADLFDQAQQAVSAEGAINFYGETTSEAVLEQAIKNYFDTIPMTRREKKMSTKRERDTVRDTIVKGLLHDEVFSIWVEDSLPLPEERTTWRWPEELIGSAYDDNAPAGADVSFYDMGWTESWLDQWSLIGQNTEIPERIVGEIIRIQNKQGKMMQ